MDKKEIFELFKEGEGLEIAEAIRKNVKDLNDLKVFFKKNSIKADKLKTSIAEKKARIITLQKSAEGALDNKGIQGEIYSIVNELKELKVEHSDKIEKMKSAKTQIYSLESDIKNCKRTLVTNFESYLRSRYSLELEDKSIDKQSSDTGHTLSRSSAHQDPEVTAYLRARQRFNQIHQARKELRMRGQL